MGTVYLTKFHPEDLRQVDIEGDISKGEVVFLKGTDGVEDFDWDQLKTLFPAIEEEVLALDSFLDAAERADSAIDFIKEER